MSKKILLIDDDKDFTDDLSFLLDGPYQFASATESKQAIALLEKEKFDLVILDLVIPAFYADEDEMEGIEVLKIIRSRWGTEDGERIPVIVLTRMDTEGSRRKCLELRVDAFFVKPPVIRTLGEKINGLL